MPRLSTLAHAMIKSSLDDQDSSLFLILVFHLDVYIYTAFPPPFSLLVFVFVKNRGDTMLGTGAAYLGSKHQEERAMLTLIKLGEKLNLLSPIHCTSVFVERFEMSICVFQCTYLHIGR